MIRLVIAIGLACVGLSAQTITVTASRTVNLQPNEVVLTVQARGRSLADTLAALAPLGAKAANLSGVALGSQHGGAESLTWNFTWAVPLVQLDQSIASLLALSRPHGAVLGFNVDYVDTSPMNIDAQACSWSDLIADARAQAQKLAAAANLQLGPVVALSDAPSGGYFVNFTISDFLESRAAIVSAPTTTCSAVVQFSLTPPA